MRVAVVGAGLSGLAAAHELTRSGGVRVTVYEKEDHLGGANKTVAVDGGAGRVVLVDLGFMVFNPVTSPNMMEWFERLGVETDTSDMSFSSSMRLINKGQGLEWGSRNGMSSVLAQKSNLLSPRFWFLVHEIFKFKNHALEYLEGHERNPDRYETLGQFIQSHRYSQLFQDAYLIPLCACIWASPSQGVLGFPAVFVLSFFRDNQLLELFSRSQWLTVKGGSVSYLDKLRQELESNGCQIKIGCEVNSVSKFSGGYRIIEADGSEEMYDRIIFSVHAPDALKVLGAEATHEELRILGAFQYIHSNVYLHCDESLMPHNSSAWGARNFLGTTSTGVSCVTSWLNILQNIESAGPLFLTLNPPRVPNHVLLKWHTSHPIPSIAAGKANHELNNIQGKRGIWFCGAYQGYGYHEDSVKAGKAAASGLLGRKCDILVNPKPMVPSWTDACARHLVARNLDKYITIGIFCILEEGGTTFSFGKACERCNLKSVIRVHDPQFYWKLATEGDLGFASAYINGYISFVDHRNGLVNIVRIFLANRAERKRLNSIDQKSYGRKAWWAPLLGVTGVAFAKYFLRHALRKNSVSKARKNISEHYDLSNDFFALYLDPSMTYSSGIFKVEDESLETAQLRKLDSLINKAKVESEHHVLDIGCGWGTLAIRLVKKTNCKYTGITLAEEQLKYAKRKVKESGLEDRITLLRCDYRQLPTSLKFDRIISCEMIEHVGHEYMDDFFGCCEHHLAEHGLLVLQSIVFPEEMYDKMRMRPEFAKTYIFPGGCLPSMGRIVSAMSNASRLNIQHVENIGDHYYPTLMNWLDNFLANREKAFALGFDDKFIRTWEYYLGYCAAMFKSRLTMDYQIVFARPYDSKLPSYVAIA